VPRRFLFSWDERNTPHIAEHAVSPSEAAEVVLNTSAPFPREMADDKHQFWDRTDRGRYLQVICIFPADEDVDITTLSPEDVIAFSDGSGCVVYVIHARDLTDREKRQLRRLRRS
jgi:hypothetical protein